MANAGTIVVGLIAQTRNFERGMGGAGKVTRDFQKQLKSVDATMRLALSTARISAVVYGMTQLLEGATAYHRALREGESHMQAISAAILKAVPGGEALSRAAQDMADEWTGIGPLVDKLKEIENVRLNLQGMFEKDDQLTKALKQVDAAQKAAEGSNLTKNVFDAYRRKAAKMYDTEGNDKAKQQADFLDNLYKTMSELRGQAAGLDKLTMSLNALDHEIGLSSAAYLKLKGVIDQINELQKNEDDKSRAKDIIEGLKTPLEKLQEQRDELEKLFVQGLLDSDQYRRAFDSLDNGRDFAGGGGAEPQVFDARNIDVKAFQGNEDTLLLKSLVTGQNELLSIHRKAFN